MFCHLAILIGLCGLSAAMLDLSYICNDSRIGDIVPNPVNCESYFICSTVPMLRYCDVGLHFDARRKVCNWPAYANCKITETLQTPLLQPVTTTENSVTNTSATTIDSSTNTTPDLNWWHDDKPQPNFMAIDVDSGRLINPMDKYDPKHIECRHFGAYFLPHPRNCHQYFVCAYGHLLQHKCGRGTLWNYKREECELASETECYAKAAADIVDGEEFSTTTRISSTTAYLPTTTSIYQSTVCYPIYTSEGSTWHPTGTYHTATATEPTPHYSTVSSSRTPSTVTTYAATKLPQSSSTPRIDSAVLECPNNREGYLSHPKDCSKYYICILGMPVKTSCPDGYYWDQKAEFCDLAKNVQCVQK